MTQSRLCPPLYRAWRRVPELAGSECEMSEAWMTAHGMRSCDAGLDGGSVGWLVATAVAAQCPRPRQSTEFDCSDGAA